MLKRIQAPLVLLNFLKSNTYKELPCGLWDNQLWFYQTIQELLLDTLDSDIPESYHLYTICDKNEVNGIGCVSINDTDADLVVEMKNNMISYEDIAQLKTFYHLDLNITVNNLLLAEHIKALTKTEYKTGDIKLYNENGMDFESLYPVTELKADSKYINWDWPMDDVMNLGLRYFGIIEGNKLISLCGICTLSAFRTEIIAVWTAPEYRHKGYAKSLCSAALKEAHKITPIVTWTTDVSNRESRMTASSLGFTPYMELYHFKLTRSAS